MIANGRSVCIKVDDGNSRASEPLLARVLLGLPDDVWTADERAALAKYVESPLHNWAGIEVGRVRALERDERE